MNLLNVIICFKQKTAYDLRISDWSSDVCSSDLFADGLVATDLDLSVAAIPRRRTLATRLLLGYVAWAKALDVAIVQCGNTTIADRDEFSMSFAIAGFRPVGNVFQHQGD